MTKRFLLTVGVIITIIAGITIAIVSSCLNSKDSWRNDDGSLLVKPTTIERLNEFVGSDEDKLEINLSKVNTIDSIKIEDETRNKDTLIVDGNGGCFTNFTIQTNAQKVIVKNIVVKNTNTAFLKMQAAYATLELDSVFIEIEKFANGIELTGEKCLLTVVNSNKIKGGYADFCQNGFSAIIGKNIEFLSKEGTSSKLELVGGKAGQGISASNTPDAYSYDTDTRNSSKWISTGEDGADGHDSRDALDNALPAGQGGDALVCQEEITVRKNVVLICIGGDGNNSGNGGSTGAGGDGEGARNPSGPFGNWRTYSGGKGGSSGDASNGAAESRMGVGCYCKKITIDTNAVVVSKKGARGSHGKAGKAGEPGVGGYGSAASVTDWDGATHIQADSGTKGKDGKDGRALSDDEIFDYICQEIIGEIKTTY